MHTLLLVAALATSQVVSAEATLSVTPQSFTNQAVCAALPVSSTLSFRGTASWVPDAGSYELGSGIWESGDYTEQMDAGYSDQWGWVSPSPRNAVSHWESVGFDHNTGIGGLSLVPFDGPPENIVCQYSLKLLTYSELLPGDANRDTLFDSGDMIAVFTAGLYETMQPADWHEGDWNADGIFSTRDLTLALQTGTYEMPTGPSAVPEPVGMMLWGLMLLRMRPSRQGRVFARQK